MQLKVWSKLEPTQLIHVVIFATLRVYTNKSLAPSVVIKFPATLLSLCTQTDPGCTNACSYLLLCLPVATNLYCFGCIPGCIAVVLLELVENCKNLYHA